MKSTVSVLNEKYLLTKDLSSYQEEIQGKINNTNFFENVFLMMKYRGYNSKLGEFIVKTLKEKGLNGVMANMKDWMITGDSVLNPLAVLYCCNYGIALFDKPEDGQYYGPNVAYELGIMHSQNKKCLILIHEDICNKKPFDFLAKIHKVYKEQLDVQELVSLWIEENNIKACSNTKRENYKIAVGIVKYKDRFLMTKRRKNENSLLWGFPAVQLKPCLDQATLLENEIKKETNIVARPILMIGERAHPNTPTYVYYWFCEYIEGDIINGDEQENEYVEWKTANEALSLITSDTFPPLKELLIQSKL